MIYSCDDDLYSLYGALASGRNTLLLSNDKMGDKRERMSIREAAILDKWRRVIQVALVWGEQEQKLSLSVSHPYGSI